LASGAVGTDDQDASRWELLLRCRNGQPNRASKIVNVVAAVTLRAYHGGVAEYASAREDHLLHEERGS
jgi:hypothetical protein